MKNQLHPTSGRSLAAVFLGALLFVPVHLRASSADSAMATARNLAASGEPSGALEVLRPHRDGPSAVAVIALAGNIRFAIGDYAGAVDEFRSLVDRTPETDAAWRNLLSALYSAGEYPEAEEVLARIEGRDDSPRVLLYAGLLAARRGDFAVASEQLEEVVARLPGDHVAAYELGLLHLDGDDPDRAASSFLEALRRRPDHAQSHYNLALALRRLGRDAEARQHLERYREISSAAHAATTRRQRAVALARRGQESLAAGDPEAALADFRAALELAPEDPVLPQLEQAARSALGDAGP